MNFFQTEEERVAEDQAAGLLVRGLTVAQAAAELIAAGFDRRTAWVAALAAQAVLAIGL